MKKKTMQTIFVLLFILGVVVGLLVPLDYKTIKKKVMQSSLQPQVIDISKKLGQLEVNAEYFKYSALAATETGGVELVRVDDKIPLHMHPKETHFVYIYKGRAKGTVGDVTAEVGPGQLVVIPVGVPHSFERIGDTPVDIILFSSPPFMEKDIVWLDKK